MAVTGTVSNHAKYQYAKKKLDLSADTIKVLLMRSAFSFNKDNHAKKINIKASYTNTTLSINASLELEDSTSGFLTEGFVPGNQVTMSGWTNGGNNTTKIINTVSASKITFTNTAGLVQEAAGNSVTILSNDELANGNGYAADTKVLANQALTEDDTNDRAEMTADDVNWTANGGNIGPTPGSIFYDDSSEDDTILGYLDFDGEKTAATGLNFSITNIKLRLS